MEKETSILSLYQMNTNSTEEARIAVVYKKNISIFVLTW